MPNCRFTSTPEVPPPPGSSLGPSKACVLQCLSPWPLKNAEFSRVWGAMAPKGSLVTCLVRLGQQNHPKRLPKFPFCCTFWRVGSKVVFSLLFWCFPRGSDPRSARAGAVETQFFILGVASKRVSFLPQLFEHSWYIWRRNPLKKALQNRA